MSTPAIIRYVETLPVGIGGRTKFFFVSILTKYRNDYGILRHELEHVRQFWVMWILFIAASGAAYLADPRVAMWGTAAGFFAHQAIYTYVRSYRLWCEARAYAQQVKPDRSDLHEMAWRLSGPRYRLNISTEQAEAEILKHLT